MGPGPFDVGVIRAPHELVDPELLAHRDDIAIQKRRTEVTIALEILARLARKLPAHVLEHRQLVLAIEGGEGGHAIRDLELEAEIGELARNFGIGAQFGGKYFCHDVRVIRLPRHGASLPIGFGVSCSADRQALGKITTDGVFLEQLESNPAKYLPDVTGAELDGDVVRIDMEGQIFDLPFEEIQRAKLIMNDELLALAEAGRAQH